VTLKGKKIEYENRKEYYYQAPLSVTVGIKIGMNAQD